MMKKWFTYYWRELRIWFFRKAGYLVIRREDEEEELLGVETLRKLGVKVKVI